MTPKQQAKLKKFEDVIDKLIKECHDADISVGEIGCLFAASLWSGGYAAALEESKAEALARKRQ